MSKRLALWLFIILNFFFASFYQLKSDILFHVDIARDFLVMEEMVTLKKLTLIGARSGGIPGLFHGPLWFYLNLPAFILGHGNPIFVGFFWIVLYALSLAVIYKISKQIFNNTIAMLSTSLFASTTAVSIFGLFNPFGAVILSPIMFYFYYLYIKKHRITDAFLSLFLLGLLIHFQMAFGLPILLLMSSHLFILFIKNRKISHFASFISLPIALSTFILFDLRHQFLQITSLFKYVSGSSEMGNLKLIPLLISRVRGFFIGGLQITTEEFLPISVAITILFIYFFYRLYKNKIFPKRNFYFLFLYLYSGYWALVFLFKGPIWNYYLIPFMPLTIIIFASLYNKFNKKIYYALFISLILFNTCINFNHVLSADKFIDKNGSSWQFNLMMAKSIYKKAGSEFGYYIFSPEMFGYTPRYAMNYYQKLDNNKKSYPFEKKKETYLILLPVPDDRPDISIDWWIKNQVKINKKPQQVIKYDNGYIIQKYLLTDKEISISADPNLLKDLHFR
ncbi:hypothetical protein A3C23_05130 [Candidatus Roizmanbacteria bacterium RIFCSPHIGHO2_02_FULL_37_13b]|uniref:Uncharacterized protein n=1 Tax=Candidatus Roizmanbacteria bacterium RIFCSPLOWO2_02_FULL_36_11 TaxID=1802071 RepID=A0A1F7JFN0_9BACT|nr:MAG: hypothetical protein A3C23_05130 [Candidatus Roizmanbacteria bacterium RIFCSPHIGHO2_02_FULL_37_13b]OGK54404.1 MAG: hypothetical protein A3H78_03740 [Candidatus Roizmanbacteria bacterium RIFCSPLOWO2_02_FULL_36_11]